MSEPAESQESENEAAEPTEQLASPVIGVPEPDSSPQASSAEGADHQPAPSKETVLQLRQIAGLTAGSVMELHAGSFQFRESNKEVGFSLVVNSREDVVVLPGAAAAMVDEIAVVDPTPLGASVLNVGSACFSVRPPRPEPNPLDLAEMLEAARRPAKAITVPELTDGEKADVQANSSRFGSLFSKDPEGIEPSLDGQDWAFLESIRDARGVMAERHRYLHPNPEELRSRLDRLDPGLWDRTIEHSLFARFAVAYSTIPWEPRFDDPNRIPPPLHQPIQEMSCLPWVPITANLLFGPLAIVGSRSAALACARSAVLALACLTSPNDIEFSIVTAQGLVDDWNWTSSLPNSLFPTGSNNYCVAVADGMTHFEGAGFDFEAVANNEMGLIVLAESMDELPEGCGTILEITPDGQCQVTNHLNEQITGTPIGVTADFAADTASIIREAVGDGYQEELAEQLPATDPAQPQAETVQPRAEATVRSPAQGLAERAKPAAAVAESTAESTADDPMPEIEDGGLLMSKAVETDPDITATMQSEEGSIDELLREVLDGPDTDADGPAGHGEPPSVEDGQDPGSDPSNGQAGAETDTTDSIGNHQA